MLTERSKITLAELLALISSDAMTRLASKHAVILELERQWSRKIEYLLEAMPWSNSSTMNALIGEVCRREADFRSEMSPKWKWDSRWKELGLCLRLDGFILSDSGLQPIEPVIEGVLPIEDDLKVQLLATGLPSVDDIVRLITASAGHFTAPTPDYNACLTDMRVALETLAREVADARKQKHPGTFDRTKWGELIAYLRVSGFITAEEEKGLAGVYGFLSPGAHRPVTDEDKREMARLGRNMALGMCYFLVRSYNQ